MSTGSRALLRSCSRAPVGVMPEIIMRGVFSPLQQSSRVYLLGEPSCFATGHSCHSHSQGVAVTLLLAGAEQPWKQANHST